MFSYIMKKTRKIKIHSGFTKSNNFSLIDSQIIQKFSHHTDIAFMDTLAFFID